MPDNKSRSQRLAAPVRLTVLSALHDSLTRVERSVFLNGDAELNFCEIFCPLIDRIVIVDEVGNLDRIVVMQFIDILVNIRTKVKNESAGSLLDTTIERLGDYAGLGVVPPSVMRLSECIADVTPGEPPVRRSAHIAQSRKLVVPVAPVEDRDRSADDSGSFDVFGDVDKGS